MRFKKYVCPKADKDDKFNPGGCWYSGFMNRDSNICENCGIDYNDTITIWQKINLTFPHWVRRPFIHPVQDIKYQWRYFWQRLFRGFDDTELWSLRYTCAKLMAPRVRAFIDTWGARSVPAGLDVADLKPSKNSQKQWLKILEKIQLAFQLIVDSDDSVWSLSKKEQKQVEEGLDLFRKYFHDLWD